MEKQDRNIMKLDDSIISIKGIGEKSASSFSKLGINTIKDLLFHFPRRYDTYPEPTNIDESYIGDNIAFSGKVIKEGKPIKIRNLTILNISVKSLNTICKITFFNMPYIRNVLKMNAEFVFYGRLQKNNAGFFVEQPKLYKTEEYQILTKSLQPVYPTSEGLTNKAITKAIRNATPYIELIKDFIPDEILTDNDFMNLKDTVYHMHHPVDMIDFERARKRLAFQEFLCFLLSVKHMKQRCSYLNNTHRMLEVSETTRILQSLPYNMTNAQNKVWTDIKDDLQSNHVMNRLIQGDVGSGKTIIAFLSMIMTVANGFQAALMAPTEVLAKQHYNQMHELLKKNKLDYKVCLLTGSTPSKERRIILEEISTGKIQLIIGTHAVFQETVVYHKLALAITDEQHRFGVKQREELFKKGEHCHVLVMSATPIPRSLAMILYSDMNLSIIDEIPAGRQKIKSCVVSPSYRQKAHSFIINEVEAGRQAYIICPMIEESDTTELESAVSYYEKLKATLPETIQLGLLHGKMKNEEKNRIMELFSEKKIDVLVSTTVIEVGINVPNATVMMIENAERFGLATLHQLRGRVGRGTSQSYCIFINGQKSSIENDRLNILLKSSNGFDIANEDLKLRGPGDITGTRQSGDIPFQIADIYNDSGILEIADRVSNKILEENTEYSAQRYNALYEYIETTKNNKVDFRSI